MENAPIPGMFRPLCIFFLAASSLVLLASVAPAAPLSLTPSTEPENDYPSGQPIPDSATGQQLRQVNEAWAKRVIAGEHQRSQPGEANLTAFLNGAALYLVWATDDAKRKLNFQAFLLEKAGSDDPVFQLMAGLVQNSAQDSEKYFRRATSGFQKTRHPRFLLYMAAANLGKSLHDRKADPAEVAEADRIALEGLKDGLNTDSFRADEMPALRWRLSSFSSDSLVRRQGAKVSDIFKQAVNVPDWIKEFGQGRGYQMAAWEARTDDWASNVTEPGWVGWSLNLAGAREHFTKAWEANRQDPAAAACMIEIAMGDGGDKQEIRRWFDRSVAAQLDFWDAYRCFIWALRPRWHGSHAEMLQFGDECLRTGRFDTNVPGYYFKVVRDIASEEEDRDAIYRRPEIYRNIMLAVDGYLSCKEPAYSKSYAHTLAALVEYKNGNLLGARTHMAAIDFSPAISEDFGRMEGLPQMLQAVLAR